MKLLKAIVIFILFFSVACKSQTKPEIMKEDYVKPEAIGDCTIIKTGFDFTEGPAADSEGNVYFSDQPNDVIYKWDAVSNEITTFLSKTGRTNGMAFDKSGHIIACADMYGELWKIAPDGSHEVLVDNFEGRRLNGPNDVWINPNDGGIYITDPIFPRNYWSKDDPRRQDWPPTHSEQSEKGKGGHVYYLAPGSKKLIRVSNMAEWDADCWPNGVVGTSDGKKLYVNKWQNDNLGGTYAFDINTDGTLSNMKKFVDMGGDGMSMDEHGNIYISNGLGVTVFNPKGEKILTIDSGHKTTNNTFAGSDGKTLFITTQNEVKILKMTVKGSE